MTRHLAVAAVWLAAMALAVFSVGRPPVMAALLFAGGVLVAEQLVALVDELLDRWRWW